MKNREIVNDMAFYDLLSNMNLNLLRSCIKRNSPKDTGVRFCIMDALYGYGDYKCKPDQMCDECIQNWMNEDRVKDRL